MNHLEDLQSQSDDATPEEKVLTKKGVEPINLYEHEGREDSPCLPHLACEIESVQLLSVTVGSGSFSEISQVIWYGSYCAGKRINLFRLSPRVGDSDEAFLGYCERAMTLRHPNLVEFYGVFRPRTTCPILVTELMYCSLRHRINAVAYPTLTFIEKCNIAYSVICALTYLHSISPALSHGNLTPDNILLDQQLRTKVSDAGLARTLSENHSNMLECYKHVGILAYMPPEVDRDCSTATDVFSFGVVFLEMLCEMYPQPLADPPLPEAGAQNAGLERSQNEIERRRMYLNLIQDQPFCSEIIQHCLSDEPEQRPVADFIANIFRNKGHEWKNNIPGNSAKPELPHSFIFPPPSDQMRGNETMTPTEKLMLGNLLNSPSPAEPSKSVSAMWSEANKHGDLLDPQSKLFSNPLPGPSGYYAPAGFTPFPLSQRANFGPTFMGPHIPMPFPNVPSFSYLGPRKDRIRLQPVPEVLGSMPHELEGGLAGDLYSEHLENSQQLEAVSSEHVSLPHKIDRCEVISCDKILFLYDLQEGFTYAYDTNAQKWSEVQQCPRVGAAPVLYNHQLVVLGGKKDPSSTFIGKELFALDYDPIHSNWTQKYASMLRHRRFAVAFSYHEFIVVIGGDSGLNSVEVYNGTKDAWSRAANFIETSRFVDSAVVIHDHAYVLLSAQTKQTLNKYSVIYWANLSVLNEGSDDLVWFLLDDKIAQPSYALAKWDNYLFAVTCVRQSFSEMLVYDMERHRWTFLCSLKIRHTLCGTGVVQTSPSTAQIFILGGNNREGLGDHVCVKSLI